MAPGTLRTDPQAAIDRLVDHPHSGHVTDAAGLRRIVINPYPYVIFYQPTATEVVIHSIRHTARRG